MSIKKKTRKKRARKKFAESRKSTAKKNLQKKNEQADRARVKRSQRSTGSSIPWSGRERASGEQSGDLQEVPTAETADSESVDELLEEGNAFEAGIVDGVEDAEAHSERGVHTREVPEDDVPSEYLDRDE